MQETRAEEATFPMGRNGKDVASQRKKHHKKPEVWLLGFIFKLATACEVFPCGEKSRCPKQNGFKTNINNQREADTFLLNKSRTATSVNPKVSARPREQSLSVGPFQGALRILFFLLAVIIRPVQ